MSMVTSIGRLAAGFALLSSFAVSATGCVYDNDPPRHLDRPGGQAGGETSGNTVGAMHAIIDSNETLTATAGEGVGVFVEYVSGGIWNVWWTCDTNLTGSACNFRVDASMVEGAIEELDASAAGGGATRPADNRVVVTATTGADIHGISFKASPGAELLLDATLNGVRDGSFIFFVQDGKVRGGYQDRVTDPLYLKGNRP